MEEEHSRCEIRADLMCVFEKQQGGQRPQQSKEEKECEEREAGRAGGRCHRRDGASEAMVRTLDFILNSP